MKDLMELLLTVFILGVSTLIVYGMTYVINFYTGIPESLILSVGMLSLVSIVALKS